MQLSIPPRSHHSLSWTQPRSMAPKPLLCHSLQGAARGGCQVTPKGVPLGPVVLRKPCLRPACLPNKQERKGQCQVLLTHSAGI